MSPVRKAGRAARAQPGKAAATGGGGLMAIVAAVQGHDSLALLAAVLAAVPHVVAYVVARGGLRGLLRQLLGR